MFLSLSSFSIFKVLLPAFSLPSPFKILMSFMPVVLCFDELNVLLNDIIWTVAGGLGAPCTHVLLLHFKAFDYI